MKFSVLKRHIVVSTCEALDDHGLETRTVSPRYAQKVNKTQNKVEVEHLLYITTLLAPDFAVRDSHQTTCLTSVPVSGPWWPPPGTLGPSVTPITEVSPGSSDCSVRHCSTAEPAAPRTKLQLPHDHLHEVFSSGI